MEKHSQKQEEILNYWFGDIHHNDYPQEKTKLWFTKSKEIDLEIEKLFSEDIQKAAGGEYNNWLSTPRGQLSFILLLDQLSRNVYRDTPKAFAYDPLALQVAKQGIANGDDRKLNPIERVFYYLPFEHSEEIEMQELSIQYFQQLLNDVDSTKKETFTSYLDYAIQHQKIIERFARYPHRNHILGRSSTPEEIEFLKQASVF